MMKKYQYMIGGILIWSIMGGVFVAARAESFETTKLPYARGQRFVVTQGYHASPTHIKKDDYAIDFSQNGCDAYAKPVLAAASGKTWIVQDAGYNGGYGTELLVLGPGIECRF